jgi:nucleotide-binding universal stress UspA family protein
MGTIVVGIDPSGGGIAALCWALEEGAIRADEVHAVLVWDEREEQRHRHRHRAHGEHDLPDADPPQVLRDIMDMAPPHPGVPVSGTTRGGRPARTLLAEASDADLLVVGAGGVGRFWRTLLGSVSHHCATHAVCPTVVVRGEAADHLGGPGRILVAIDDSDSSVGALRWAVDEARRRGCSLEVVHIWHPPYLGGDLFTPAAFDPAPFEREARRVLDETVEAVDTSGLVTPVERLLAEGGAASTIRDLAFGADLVVLGSRGMGSLKRFLAGSVTQQVIDHAPCPVVVAPGARSRRSDHVH